VSGRTKTYQGADFDPTGRRCAAEGLPPSDDLILDLCYLILREIYGLQSSHLDVYWGIMKRLMVECGGLPKLRPFTACLAIGTDHMLHASTFRRPDFDFKKLPEFLGLHIPEGTDGSQVEMMVRTTIAQLDA